MASTHPLETHNGAVTIWLPITTAWPSQPQCASIMSGTYNAVAYGIPSLNLPKNPPSCLPPQWTSWWTQNNSATITSLGPFTCPQQWSTVSTFEVDGSSTLVLCCPKSVYSSPELVSTGLFGARGYDFSYYRPNGAVDECTSYATLGQVLHLYPQGTDSFTGQLTTTVTTSSVVIAAHINGYVFKNQVVVPASTSVSSVTGTSAVASAFASSSPTSSPSSSTSASTSSKVDTTSQAQQTSDGLPTGAKIGIGIAVPLAVIRIAALLAAFFLLRRRHHTSSLVSIYEAPSGQPTYNTQELDSVQMRAELTEGKAQRAELYGMDRGELVGSGRLYELSEGSMRGSDKGLRS